MFELWRSRIAEVPSNKKSLYLGVLSMRFSVYTNLFSHLNPPKKLFFLREQAIEWPKELV
jgi:hypothetical protein